MSRAELEITRADGTEIRVVAQLGPNPLRAQPEVDMFVLFRHCAADPWAVASDIPSPGWRSMPLSQYVTEGRSKLRQLLSPGELLQAGQTLRHQLGLS